MKNHLQTTIEYVAIITVVAMAAILVSLMYMHGSSSTTIGNQNAVLNAKYFVSNNGQNICDPSSPVIENFSKNEIGTSCLVFVTEDPLPKMDNYTINQLSSSNFSVEYNDTYYLGFTANQNIFYGGGTLFFPTFENSYDNADFAYLGKVDGYYEYMIYLYGFSPMFNSFNLEYIYLNKYVPNIGTGSEVKSTDILPIKNNLLVSVVHTNQTVGVIPVSGNFGVFKNPSANATITISGLPKGAQTTLNYQYYNTSSGIENVSKVITFNSSNPVSLTITNLLNFTNFVASVSPNVTFGDNDFFATSNSSVYGAGSQISFNYNKISVGTLVYNVNKPLVKGSQVYFSLPNSSFYYVAKPYSNLEFSVGNSIKNGGTPIDAFISNYTPNYVVVNLGSLPSGDIGSVYLNFMSLNNNQPLSYTTFSPYYNNTDPNTNTSIAESIFSTYQNINGYVSTAMTAPNTTGKSWYNMLLFSNPAPSTYYSIGAIMPLGGIDSYGFNNTDDLFETNPSTEGPDQAPYNGIYSEGSGMSVKLGLADSSEGIRDSLYVNKKTGIYIGPMTMEFSNNGETNEFNAELLSTSETASMSSNIIPSDLVAYSGSGSNFFIISYLASSPNNILGYSSSYEGYVAG